MMLGAGKFAIRQFCGNPKGSWPKIADGAPDAHKVKAFAAELISAGKFKNAHLATI